MSLESVTGYIAGVLVVMADWIQGNSESASLLVLGILIGKVFL